ncbi:hypothetical protein ABZ172_03945 [Streptomyces sp. NPDC006296]|uniref:hypothetical protein n=1 Tax=Streptomyces sp. NPDC006296 TaxID=3156746 RepID=UPI0033AD73D5
MILAEIEERAVEDVKHNKRRECESRWRAAVEEAKKLALREQLAMGLRDEAARRSPRRRR